MPPENREESPHRTEIRSVRFTPSEWAEVRQRAELVHLSPARFLRHAALGLPLGHRLNAEAVLALNRIGVNLNQLIRIALRSDQPALVQEAKAVLAELSQGLRSLL